MRFQRGWGTYHVGGAGAVRVTGVGRRGPGGARVVVGVAEIGFGAVPLVDDQIDGHFALQAADVTVAEVVAQLVNLIHNKKKTIIIHFYTIIKSLLLL